MQSPSIKATSSNLWLSLGWPDAHPMTPPRPATCSLRSTTGATVASSSARGLNSGVTSAHHLFAPSCGQEAVEPALSVLDSARPVKSVQPWRTRDERDTPSFADALARVIADLRRVRRLPCCGTTVVVLRWPSRGSQRGRRVPYGSPYHRPTPCRTGPAGQSRSRRPSPAAGSHSGCASTAHGTTSRTGWASSGARR